eukprot:SAG31_NODE_231_length_19768_cov_9.498170_11_plen_102_part_00
MLQNEFTGESTYDLASLLPAGWTVLVSRSTGHTFYHNEESGESTFEWPVPPESGGKMSGIGDAAATEPPPPPGWEVVVSRRTGCVACEISCRNFSESAIPG